MFKDVFGMTDDDFSEKRFQGNEIVACQTPIRLSDSQIQTIKNIVGEKNLSTSDYDRVKYASGKTMEEAMALRKGIARDVPDIVVHPRDKHDVSKLVAYCAREKIPVYAYGGGSSVTLGLKCPNGGVTLVMGTHMNRVLAFSERNQTITVEPGMSGPLYEDTLNRAPERLDAKACYTGGHFPQSFEYSSVGGWIVTLGSGQASSYYGDIYDIVLSQEYVTPKGSFKTHDYPGTATGPKVNDIMKGSEGAFGILVSATMRIFKYRPENRYRFAFMFPSWEAAVEASRGISQGEFGMPAVYRISDPEETCVGLKLFGLEGTLLDKWMTRRGYKPMERCLCLGHTEGEKNFSRHVKKRIKKICRSFDAMYLTGYAAGKWEHGRYTEQYMREDLCDYGIVIDTLETSVTWETLHKIHQDVRGFIKSRPRTLCLTHASHFYPQGTNLYFIFIARMDDIDEYRTFQRKIIASIENSGGSLSHHHGIGRMMAPLMRKHLGKEQMDILIALKQHFDPDHIMNPGVMLGLDL